MPRKTKKQRKKEIRDGLGFVGSTVISDDPEVLRDLIAEYFFHCEAKFVASTVTGIATCLGLTRKQLLEFSEDDHNDPEVVGLVVAARQFIEEYLERRLQSNTHSGAAFALRAQFNWQDMRKIGVGTGRDGNTPIGLLGPRTIDPEKLSTTVIKALRKHRDSSGEKS